MLDSNVKIERRPDRISRQLTASLFTQFYWTVVELNDFCQQVSLSMVGDKEAKIKRIAHYLETGQAMEVVTKAPAGPKDSERGLITRDTLVHHYKNDVATRNFFQEQLGGHFKFSVTFHNYRRDLLSSGQQITYGDLVEALKEIQQTKTAPIQGLSAAREFNDS